jgi:hypothetical protein
MDRIGQESLFYLYNKDEDSIIDLKKKYLFLLSYGAKCPEYCE